MYVKWRKDLVHIFVTYVRNVAREYVLEKKKKWQDAIESRNLKKTTYNNFQKSKREEEKVEEILSYLSRSFLSADGPNGYNEWSNNEEGDHDRTNSSAESINAVLNDHNTRRNGLLQYLITFLYFTNLSWSEQTLAVWAVKTEAGKHFKALSSTTN